MRTRDCLIGLVMAAGIAVAEPPARVGLPVDWSHHAIVYNAPLSSEGMNSAELEAWTRGWQDPRFMAHMIRKAEWQAAAQEAAHPQAKAAYGQMRKPVATDSTQRDWSNVLGGASGKGVAGTYPAKYSFDVNATPSCANDFVVFVTGTAGVTGSGAFASNTGTFTGLPAAGQTATITNGTRVLVLTAATTANGSSFLIGADAASTASNLSDAINRTGGMVGVTASVSGATVTVTSITQGTSSIALGLGTTTPATSPLANFTWAGATLAGGTGGVAGQPTIVAFNNLYKGASPGCGGVTGSASVPKTFWSYNTSGTASTSPVLSLDGTQVAFTDVVGTTANLVILKWSSTVSVGTIGAPTAPAFAPDPVSYRSCTAPCMYKIAMASNNARSSLFYDYSADAAYVGGSDGRLYKFTGVFNGTPAGAGSPWPVTVSSGNALSSPVYDSGSGLVFVGSAAGAASGGQLHSVDASGNVLSSGQLAALNSIGVGDSPFVDSFAQRVYAYVAMDNSTSCSSKNCEAVYQFPTNSSIAGLTSPKAVVGTGFDPIRFLRAGAFDSAYWNSTPTSPTGFLYVCGGATNATGRVPTLWRIPITANAMGAAIAGPGLTSNSQANECAPMVDVSNGTNDYLFVSVPSNGNFGNTFCQGSCLYMFQLTGIVWSGSLNPNASLAVSGGTTGLVMDNVVNQTGSAQIYFSNLSTPGNAVQASQSGLQ